MTEKELRKRKIDRIVNQLGKLGCEIWIATENLRGEMKEILHVYVEEG